ncbi:hypothetical protein CDAR_481811 [Caerostris darwini]|uniref:Uncharacterized protein n=1 Tax=Caerostris darwini TaxID=1538125 RepID=A0AAV4UNY6_9ARAC|nr:hypothetical protein CDAR_481811 [Caerostris darwini]
MTNIKLKSLRIRPAISAINTQTRKYLQLDRIGAKAYNLDDKNPKLQGFNVGAIESSSTLVVSSQAPSDLCSTLNHVEFAMHLQFRWSLTHEAQNPPKSVSNAYSMGVAVSPQDTSQNAMEMGNFSSLQYTTEMPRISPKLLLRGYKGTMNSLVMSSFVQTSRNLFVLLSKSNGCIKDSLSTYMH